MKIKLHINYFTRWGQSIYISGSSAQLGNWNEDKALKMTYVSSSEWSCEIESDNISSLEYRYLVKEQDKVVDVERGNPHILNLEKDVDYNVWDVWKIIPSQKFLYTSAFTNSFFQNYSSLKLKYYKSTILLNVDCPFVGKGQELIMLGASDSFGNWQPENALRLIPTGKGSWQITINATLVNGNEEFKLAIYNPSLNKIEHWEEGGNRIFPSVFSESGSSEMRVLSLIYQYRDLKWRAAGVAIPVFSLRSDTSYGIGEFSDLKKMVDWAAMTSQKVIQILPVNDTTSTRTWTDSYPYNAISIYALHPIYLGLDEFPLKDKDLTEKYKTAAVELNTLKEIDYERVLALKWEYIKSLFLEIGKKTLKSKEYLSFYEDNKDWLLPYACFCYLRDKYETPVFSEWKAHKVFNQKKLLKLIESNKEVKECIELLCFTQYLLDKQLSEVKEYAHQFGVVLKGDIPIGVNRNSVDTWMEPHLFNMDTQTGAPPDDFSFYGQNWGFPTYNWSEMAKDGYQWWIKRFRKMADFFDVYRIDHILGFFRIWEIPLTSVQGLLGYFSPALPLSKEEISSYGLAFDEERMTKPQIYAPFLENIFGEHTMEVIDKYLNRVEERLFELREEYNTQSKIKEQFEYKKDDISSHIRDGLYQVCDEVLFIRDKYETDKYHPRITSQYSYSFKRLSDSHKDAYNRLYNEYFFKRHNQYWRNQAMEKLPVLISSTSMLVCGEDLGMVPESVPSVMKELQILSLEIERMPKELGITFSRLSSLPYLSVCTTSTHDMSPIRLWWKEDKSLTQKYYNEVLWKQGAAPEDCTSDICKQIVYNHLNAPSMLTILPLQDWLSISDKLKRAEVAEERINIPADPRHYWRYRMHITLEELVEATDFNKQIVSLITDSGRK